MHLKLAFPTPDNIHLKKENLMYSKEFCGCNEKAKDRPIRFAWSSSLLFKHPKGSFMNL